MDRFGSGSFSATLTITVSQGMDATDQANPAGVGLYRRNATSEGAWTLVTTASSVDAATQTAVFPNVTSFGQLAVGHTVMRKQSATMPGAGTGENMALAWGDFDNDGKLDLAFTAGGSSWIYRNNGDGTFSDIGAGLPAAHAFGGSAVAWADYNGDGYLDLALGIFSGTYVYRNNGPDGSGNCTFTTVATLSPGTYFMSQEVIWGDYNNDGRPDLLVIGGISGTHGITRLYRNDGNDTFTDSGVSFPNNESASAAWGDYDTDGWLDLVVSGNAGAFIYHNNGDGTFTNIGANGLVGGMPGQVAWGDYDNDGSLDLVLANGDSVNVYHNDHNGTFTNIGVNAIFSMFAKAAWGDYDNDGRLDLLDWGISDGGSGAIQSTLFHNNGGGSFTDLGINFYPGGDNQLVYAAFGDYDNDGRLDVAVLGKDATKVWRNYSVMVNTAPTAPTGLSAGVTGGVATLNWNAATDSQTPASGLTYNLRVGTAPGKDDIMSCMADTTSGLRRVPAIGNVNMNRSWTINLPASGTYYWSVQAVDTALAGGAWGAESSFSATLDADADGLPNEWEMKYYGGTTNANPDALAANGVNTVREAYIADLNPTNPASYFRITAVSNLPPWTVYFEASAGRSYTLIGVSNLVSGIWTNVPGAGPRPGTGGADALIDTNVPPKGPFYRLKVELP